MTRWGPIWTRDIIQCVAGACEVPEERALFLAAFFGNTVLDQVGETLAVYAARGGYLQVLQLAKDLDYDLYADQLLKAATGSGQLDVFNLIMAWFPCPTREAVYAAAKKAGELGQPAMMNAVYRVNPTDTARVIGETAARYGHLKVIRGMPYHYRYILIAARRGQIQIVDWAFKTHSEKIGNIQDLCCAAFESGCPAMIDFFMKLPKYDKSCREAHFKACAKGGSVKHMAVMIEAGHRPVSHICCIAARHGHVGVLEYVRTVENFPLQERLYKILMSAAEGKHINVLEWGLPLIRQLPVMDSDSLFYMLLRVTLDFYNKNTHSALIEWVIAHTRVFDNEDEARLLGAASNCTKLLERLLYGSIPIGPVIHAALYDNAVISTNWLQNHAPTAFEWYFTTASSLSDMYVNILCHREVNLTVFALVCRHVPIKDPERAVLCIIKSGNHVGLQWMLDNYKVHWSAEICSAMRTSPSFRVKRLAPAAMLKNNNTH